jgi:hypothetical protein
MGYVSVPGGLFGDGISALNGGGSAGITDPSWGLWAQVGGSASAGRIFPGGPLALGDSVSVEFDNGWVETGAEVGVAIYALGTEALRFSFTGGDSIYRATDTTGTSNLPLLPFSVDGMTVTVTLRNNGIYDLEVDGAWMRSGVFAGGLLFADELRVFNNGAGAGPQDHDVYFNCIEVLR